MKIRDRYFVRWTGCALSATLVVAILGMTLGAAAQSTQKTSVWQQLKDAAKQAQQQKPQQKTGQPQGQRSDKPGRPSSQNPINDSGPFKPPAGTKIEEKVLGPVQQGAMFEVSPHGVHVATIGTDGSRAVVFYDGVEGPKFDQILTLEGQRVAFSPDGNRYAYCARSGNQHVVMVDGKELVRSDELQGGKCFAQYSKLGFTSNNAHVYYFAEMKETQPIDQMVNRFVFDGKPDLPSAKIDDLTFSPDGNHYAYIWNDPDRKRPWMLIVDGKPAGYQAGAPQWTADSKHLYTQKQIPGTGTELLFDGKPVMRANGLAVYIPPVGDMLVVAVTVVTNGLPHSFLVVNGKKVPGSDTVARGSIDKVVFSPDGKHYAAICGDIDSHHYVIADGKRGQEYVLVDKLSFTPDSSTVVYSANVNGKGFIVVGDQEFGAPFTAPEPVLAPVGNRVGGLITINGAPNLVMDRKITPLNPRGADDLSFSPDGAHYAYFVIDAGNGRRLVLDGVPQPQSAMAQSGYRIDLEQPVTALKYIFSPDSKHVAHFANSPSATAIAFGIFLDGKFIPASLEGANNKLSFSPDSKHLFWIHAYGDRPYRVFIDGKPLVDFYSAGGNVPHWWDFGPDGTLSFLAQDDNSLKRITITPSSETRPCDPAGRDDGCKPGLGICCLRTKKLTCTCRGISSIPGKHSVFEVRREKRRHTHEKEIHSIKCTFNRNGWGVRRNNRLRRES